MRNSIEWAGYAPVLNYARDINDRINELFY